VCEVRAPRFLLSVSASSRPPRLVLQLSTALFACVLFPPPLPLPLRPPPREGLGVAAFNYAYIMPTIAYAYMACVHGGVVPPCRREAVPIEGLSTSPSLLGFPAALPPDQRISYSDFSPVLI